LVPVPKYKLQKAFCRFSQGMLLLLLKTAKNDDFIIKKTGEKFSSRCKKMHQKSFCPALTRLGSLQRSQAHSK